jgi:hypothetical protein
MRLTSPQAATAPIILEPAPAVFRAAGAQLQTVATTLDSLRAKDAYGFPGFAVDPITTGLFDRATAQAQVAVTMLDSSTLEGAGAFKIGVEQSVLAQIQLAKAKCDAGTQHSDVRSISDAASDAARAFASALMAGATVTSG